MLNYLKACNCRLSCQHSSDLHDGQSQFSLISGAATKAPDDERVNSQRVIFIHAPSTRCQFPTAAQRTGGKAFQKNKIKQCPQLARIRPFRLYLLMKNFTAYMCLIIDWRRGWPFNLYGYREQISSTANHCAGQKVGQRLVRSYVGNSSEGRRKRASLRLKETKGQRAYFKRTTQTS